MVTREKFKIVSGQPLVVTLDRAEAKEVPSDYAPGGKEFRYEVSRNGKPGYVYLDAAGRNALVRTRVSDGEEIQILKTGQNGSTQWRVDPVSDSAEPAAGPVPVPQTVARQQAPVQQPPIPTSHPVQERMTRMFLAAAASLREAHRQIEADSFYAGRIEPPTWEDIRSVAVHWSIGLEKKEAGR